MCGIAGLFSPKEIAQESLQAMLNIIRHRGPDDEGWAAFAGNEFTVAVGGGCDTPPVCYDTELPYMPERTALMPSDAHVGIGHRRLAIVDTSPYGHQPMCDLEERYWIVFNGEIYNHGILRDELSELGYRFVSHSDTEVILAAYAIWNESCLERLEGMFAFVIIDRILKTAWIVRDRFGIKPLYYWVASEGTLALASEIKQFTVLPGWKAIVNGQRAYDFLAWGIIDHTDETLFDGVYQFRPGTCAKIDLAKPQPLLPGQKLETQTWYRLNSASFSGTFEDAANQFRSIFKNAIASHLRADVPLGSCLSGGLDSSSIVCMANELMKSQAERLAQHTFSACSTVPRYDEREYVEEVIKSTGCNGHYVYPELSDLLKHLEQITWHQDEPFGSTSIYAQWSVCALAAKNGVKVLLDGQGADEQLAGYRGYYGANFVDLFVRLKWLNLIAEVRAMSRTQGGGLGWAMKYLADALLPNGIRYLFRKMIGREIAEPEWLNIELLGAVPSDPVRGEKGAFRSIHSLSMRQLTASNLQMLLHWEDRNSMAHSIEARVPFLDHHLVEFNLGLPDAFKLSAGTTKRVLRDGLIGILPETIRNRMSKLGFVTPEEIWVRQVSPRFFRQAVKNAVEITEGILKTGAIQVVEDVIQGKRHFDFLIWRMISFSVWMKCFKVSNIKVS